MAEGSTLPCQWQGCNATFQSPDGLKSHLAEEHIGRRARQNLSLTCLWADCYRYNHPFNKRDHAISHVDVHMPNWKVHECRYCGKRFKRTWDRNKHEKVHPAGTPFLESSSSHENNASSSPQAKKSKKKKQRRPLSTSSIVRARRASTGRTDLSPLSPSSNSRGTVESYSESKRPRRATIAGPIIEQSDSEGEEDQPLEAVDEDEEMEDAVVPAPRNPPILEKPSRLRPVVSKRPQRGLSTKPKPVLKSASPSPSLKQSFESELAHGLKAEDQHSHVLENTIAEEEMEGDIEEPTTSTAVGLRSSTLDDTTPISTAFGTIYSTPSSSAPVSITTCLSRPSFSASLPTISVSSIPIIGAPLFTPSRNGIESCASSAPVRSASSFRFSFHPKGFSTSVGSTESGYLSEDGVSMKGGNDEADPLHIYDHKWPMPEPETEAEIFGFNLEDDEIFKMS